MLICRHGTTEAQALKIIKTAIAELGYNSHVIWNGRNASVAVGPFKSILNIKGMVTNTEATVECGGLFGDIALNRCREIVGRIFPDGQIIN